MLSSWWSEGRCGPDETEDGRDRRAVTGEASLSAGAPDDDGRLTEGDPEGSSTLEGRDDV